jgi:DNA-binding CsgD family transcriptional regulator
MTELSKNFSIALDFIGELDKQPVADFSDYVSKFQVYLLHLGAAGDFVLLDPNRENQFVVRLFSSTPEFEKKYTSQGLEKLPEVLSGAETSAYWWNSDADTIGLDPQSPFGMSPALVIPIFGLDGLRGIIATSAKPTNVSIEARAAITMGAIYLFNRVMHVALTDRSMLSSREREVLSWTALGKTTGDTAEILGIPEHKVAGHLSSAFKKFDVVEKTYLTPRPLVGGGHLS